jgi:hypothetical protein
MYYLVTDEENKTIGNKLWGENVTHEQNNPNYLFTVYDNPLVAHMMNPCYEGYKNAKIWHCEGTDAKKIGFLYEFVKVTTKNQATTQPPTNEQRIYFAIVCCMNLIKNQIFRNWCLNYLKGIDRTTETAHKVFLELEESIKQKELPEGHDYISCAPACLAAVQLNDPAIFSANAAHRAYYDSPENSRIDLNKIAEICVGLKPEEIGEVFS